MAEAAAAKWRPLFRRSLTRPLEPHDSVDLRLNCVVRLKAASPYRRNLPTIPPQSFCLAAISPTISRNLRAPLIDVACRRAPSSALISVPVATMDEHSNHSTAKHNIGRPRQAFRMRLE